MLMTLATWAKLGRVDRMLMHPLKIVNLVV
jgi:hypothetical protein